MLAVYVDNKLKGSYSSKDSMKIDLRNIKSIFECLENKDMFLLKYLQKLAKNILSLNVGSL